MGTKNSIEKLENRALKGLAKGLNLVANRSATPMCAFLLYEPKLPKQLQKNSVEKN